MISPAHSLYMFWTWLMRELLLLQSQQALLFNKGAVLSFTCPIQEPFQPVLPGLLYLDWCMGRYLPALNCASQSELCWLNPISFGTYIVGRHFPWFPARYQSLTPSLEAHSKNHFSHNCLFFLPLYPLGLVPRIRKASPLLRRSSNSIYRKKKFTETLLTDRMMLTGEVQILRLTYLIPCKGG